MDNGGENITISFGGGKYMPGKVINQPQHFQFTTITQTIKFLLKYVQHILYINCMY